MAVQDRDKIYNVIIVGAGIEGSCTGYCLSSRGTKDVLLLEQFDRGHTRGSSHGGSRITRKAYHKSCYVKMMEESFEMWSEIENKSGTQLYHKTGIILFGDRYENIALSHDDAGIKEFIKSLEANSVSHKIMSSQEINVKYSQQIQLPENYMCIYEEWGGILRASKAVDTIQNLFVKYGGNIIDNHTVTGIIPGQIVTVQTEKCNFKAKNVILTTGAWTNKLTQPIGLSLPLKPKKAEVLYWKAEDPQIFAVDKFPIFGCFMQNESNFIYGTPIYEYPGLLKVCMSLNIDVDPDARDSDLTCHSFEDISKFIQTILKGVEFNEPAIYELCMITKTPDDDPIIDRHPNYHNIIIGAGFSGHGFKLGPVVGKILTELVLDLPPSYDMSHFKIDRFKGLES